MSTSIATASVLEYKRRYCVWGMDAEASTIWAIERMKQRISGRSCADLIDPEEFRIMGQWQQSRIVESDMCGMRAPSFWPSDELLVLFLIRKLQMLESQSILGKIRGQHIISIKRYANNSINRR